MTLLQTRTLAGWGNMPVEQCQVGAPRSVEQFDSLLRGGSQASFISRGLGRSYGDSSLNQGEGVLLHTGLNHFRDFDPQSGWVDCEAGVSLAEIIRVALPRGWFLPTTPGTRFVTVGGAVAADVHGKNHHVDGSFGNFVEELTLLTADGSVTTCSPSSNAQLLWATIGGMGLTGVILRVRLRLTRVETAYVHVDYRRVANLDQSLAAFADTNHDYRYSVAWIDCVAKGAAMGRGILMLGNDASRDMLTGAAAQDPLKLPPRHALSVPCMAPGMLLNRWSVQAFNAVYYNRHSARSEVVDFDHYFYPLDSLAHWNRLYGRRGFIQHQVLFPTANARAGLVELLSAISDSGRASFLAVLKATGESGQGLLSFPFPGYTLALDIPCTSGFREFTAKLDAITLKHGGRLYMAKDATMSRETFAQMYPRLAEFRQIKQSVDPNCRFMSSQARRLGIVE